jgi:hypothetical protein
LQFGNAEPLEHAHVLYGFDSGSIPRDRKIHLGVRISNLIFASNFVLYIMNMHLICNSIMYLQIDTEANKCRDTSIRGGPNRRGDLTRPLKSQKSNWVEDHWWSPDGEFIWVDHMYRGVTIEPTREHLRTLKPGKEVVDEIVDAYFELLKIRDNGLWETGALAGKAKKFFIASSFFFELASGLTENVKVLNLPF